MSSPLAAAIAASSDVDLEATRRLLHRAGASRRRLGTPMIGQVLDDPWPPILAATCVEICDELTRRRGPGLGRCVACLSDVPLAGPAVPPGPGPSGQPPAPGQPVASDPTAAPELAATIGGR